MLTNDNWPHHMEFTEELSKENLDQSSDKHLDELMGLCHDEPAEPDICPACYAYKVACLREGSDWDDD